MTTQNLLSLYQGLHTVNTLGLDIDAIYKPLKNQEIPVLGKLCNLLMNETDDFSILDQFFVSYSIPQISKEFDLLRFGTDSIINIELKSPLDDTIKIDKISHQMKKNYYYLNFLGKHVKIYTYIEDDGIYQYDSATNTVTNLLAHELVTELKKQTVDFNIKIEEQFKPSNYLISPFNNVQKFLTQQYFLTGNQEDVKKAILAAFETHTSDFFCLSANAGTGKTLLSYDIIHEMIQKQTDCLIIHCGKLNQGHEHLNQTKGWHIHSISDIFPEECIPIILGSAKFILIDEAQRIRQHQVEWILNYAKNNKIYILFSYDVKQYLKENENTDIYAYLQQHHSDYTVSLKSLTTKIRTNKAMASFVKNLFKPGSSKDNLNYKAISIEYLSNIEDAQRYLCYLEKERNWKAITFTTSMYSSDSLRPLVQMSETNAHDVIGQEFEKVVLVLDNNFRYNDQQNVLETAATYYSASGMLYQIVTRVISQLKIVVLNNPNLYKNLLDIKKLGEV